MQTSNTIRAAGDVSIDKVKIITPTGFYQDITAQVITIQYYEDLFSPFISGSLIIKESLDYVNLFPFIGEEYLELEISTPTLQKGNIKGRYYIYKLTDRQYVGDRNVVYQLHFVSEEAVVDLNKKVSRVFGNKVSDLVEQFIRDKTIGLESEKQIIVEPTQNSIKYISNFWSPIKNLMYLAEHAANSNKTPNYVFYENRDGFYFISLDKLYSGPVFQEFIYDRYTRDILSDDRSVRNITEDYKRISDISIPSAYDYMDRIRSGMLSSKQISYDLVKKTYSSKNYNMFQRFDQQQHLNKYPINSDKAIFRANSKIFTLNKNYGNFNGFGDVTNSRYNQERMSLMKLAESNKVDITVPGRCDYTVGQKVYLNLTRIEPYTHRDDELTDKMFSGNYLIAAINHYIDREKHEANIQLIKESSLMDMNKGK